jgi:NAD(P)-dependent dehydrogenase (short-subunit alcohol dehydrogenase family)
MNSDHSLHGHRVVVLGAGSGLGRALARSADAAGADVVLAGRDPAALEDTLPDAERVQADISDDASLAALAERVGAFDHLVSTAAMPAKGRVAELDRAAVERAFAAKVIGPIMLVKHLAGQASDRGSFTFFSGMAAWRPSPGRVVTATTNGALSFLVQALAVELAPVRVNAISPGIVDSGSWDAMGEQKDAFLREAAGRIPARRVGTPPDVVQAVLYAMTHPYVTGTVLHVDGGGRLA